jgi:hypothetical protein
VVVLGRERPDRVVEPAGVHHREERGQDVDDREGGEPYADQVPLSISARDARKLTRAAVRLA